MQRNHENQNTSANNLPKEIEICEQYKFTLREEQPRAYFLRRSETNYDYDEFRTRCDALNKAFVDILKLIPAFQDELISVKPFVRDKDEDMLIFPVEKYSRYKNFLIRNNKPLIQDYDAFQLPKKSTKRVSRQGIFPVPVAKLHKVTYSNDTNQHINTAQLLLNKPKFNFYFPENNKLPGETRICGVPFTLNGEIYESIDFNDNCINLNQLFSKYFSVRPFIRDKVNNTENKFGINISVCKSLIRDSKDQKMIQKYFEERFIKICTMGDELPVPVQSTVINNNNNNNQFINTDLNNNNNNNSNFDSSNYTTHLASSNAMFQPSLTQQPSNPNSVKSSIRDNSPFQ